MRKGLLSKLSLFGLGWGLLLLACVCLTWSLFDVPLKLALNRFEQSGIYASLTQAKLHDFKSHRSEAALLEQFRHFQSQTPSPCLSPLYLLSDAPYFPNDSLTQIPTLTTKSLDLRASLWRLSVPGLPQQNCAFTAQALPKGGKIEWKKKVSLQWDHLRPLLEDAPILQEILLRSDPKEPQKWLLSLGRINGSSAVFQDGILIAYFPTSTESDQLIPLIFHPHQDSTLSLLTYAKGQSAPGLAHRKFVGLLAPGDSQAQIFPSSLERNTPIRTSVLLSLLAGSLLLGFALYKAKETYAYFALSQVTLAFALYQVIWLEPVQAVLDATGIRFLRWIAILSYFFAITGISLDWSLRVWRSRKDLLPRIPKVSKITALRGYAAMQRKIRRLGKLGALGFYGIFAFSSLWALFRFFTLNPQTPLAYLDQTLKLVPILWFSRGAALVCGLSLLFWIWRRLHAAEPALCRLLDSQIKNTLLIATGLALFAEFQIGFFQNWLIQKQVPGTVSYLSALSLPLTSIWVFLLTLAFDFMEMSFARRVLPPFALKELKKGRTNPLHQDLVTTDFDWLAINDLANSTPYKAHSIATVAQTLQTTLHQVHQRYLTDSLDFKSNSGDAVIFALTAPGYCSRNDSLLEKLRRAVALHVDGLKVLKENASMLQEIMKLSSEEIFLAISHSETQKKLNKIVIDSIGFRTLLAFDLSTRGTNHDILNLDSFGIYVLMKSEKHLGLPNGGFVIFPSLMKILLQSFPGIKKYFKCNKINRQVQAIDERYQQMIPTHVYILKPEKTPHLIHYLEKLSQEPLHLRFAHFSKKDYSTVRPEILDWTKSLATQTQSLSSIVAWVRKNPPRPRNFKEKNASIFALVSACLPFSPWTQPRLQKQIFRFIRKIGIPAQDHIERTLKRDHHFEPSTVLTQLQSWDCNVRNEALKLIRLTRVQSPYRPHARKVTTFIDEVLDIYLKRPASFSVQNHVLLFEYLQDRKYFPDRAKLDEVLSRHTLQLRKLIGTFHKHPAPSLHTLAHRYQFWLNRLEGAAATPEDAVSTGPCPQFKQTPEIAA